MKTFKVGDKVSWNGWLGVVQSDGLVLDGIRVEFVDYSGVSHWHLFSHDGRYLPQMTEPSIVRV